MWIERLKVSYRASLDVTISDVSIVFFTDLPLSLSLSLSLSLFFLCRAHLITSQSFLLIIVELILFLEFSLLCVSCFPAVQRYVPVLICDQRELLHPICTLALWLFSASCRVPKSPRLIKDFFSWMFFVCLFVFFVGYSSSQLFPSLK